MVITKKVKSADVLERLHLLAFSVPEEVMVTSMDGTITSDAKSSMELFAVDFSQPVHIVTDSAKVLTALEAW